MFKNIVKFVLVLITSFSFAQTGHLMQGIGAVNMSMGGAATAQPLDISGAMQWNPATLSTFSGTKLKLDVGAFFSSPELYSSLTDPNSGFVFSGSTEDERGTSPMPALAISWGKEDSKHTFGVSAFGVSGFGVTFPENLNYPGDLAGNPNPNFDPTAPTNPINWPQYAGGFGHIETDYMLLQVGFTWAYNISEKFSIGLQPTFNWASLSLEPNPLATPGPSGYPKGDATAMGFGGQIGLFYDTQNGIKLGASYKTPQTFSEFDFGDDTKFQMDYPGIFSVGMGYSKGIVEFALDYRYVDYEGTEGFQDSGWQIAEEGDFAGFPTGAVNGFGWKNISIVSAGLQLKAIDKLPLRFGYTYSTNPIDEELTFFSVPATAIIAHAFQFGFSYEFTDSFVMDAVYHYGVSDGKTEGQLLNPMMISEDNPLGKIPQSSVAYDMTTSMIMVGIQFNL